LHGKNGGGEMNKPYMVKCKECGKENCRSDRYPYTCSICRKTSYPIEFEKIKENIIPKAKCSVCGMSNSKSKKLFHKSLHLHHVNNDRTDNSAANLVVKCVQCHLGEHKKGKTLKVLSGVFGNKRIYRKDLLSSNFWQFVN